MKVSKKRKVTGCILVDVGLWLQENGKTYLKKLRQADKIRKEVRKAINKYVKEVKKLGIVDKQYNIVLVAKEIFEEKYKKEGKCSTKTVIA